MSHLRVALLCLLFASCVLASSGPPIPKPGIDARRAMVLAEEVLRGGVGLREAHVAKPQDYLLMRVEYVRTDPWEPGMPRSAGTWAWEVEFRHPIHNDHSALYRVDMNGTVVLTKAAA